MTSLFRRSLLILLVAIASSATAEPQRSPSIPTYDQGKYVTVNGRRMYVEQHGQGRTVVLLHGGAGSIHHSFEKLLPVLSTGYRVVAIEQIGHGHTPDANIPFTYSQMAEDTAALLRILKVENATIVGWSDGGNLALLIAHRYPELVRGLVISGAATRLVGMTPEQVKEIQAATPQKLVDELGPVLRDNYAAISPDGPAHWPVIAKKVWDLWLTPTVLEPADLSAIRVPVLVVCGDRDTIPLDHTLEIFRTLPKAQLLVLPGTRHHTFKMAASILNPVVLSFINTQ